MLKQIAKYQFITTDSERHSHADLAEFACLGGANWIQARIKNYDYTSWKKIAEEVKAVCKKYKATFIINDNIELAKELNADGVHLGKEDMPIVEARKFLGEDKIIGGTANTIEEVIRHGKSGVDYIGLGPFRFTNTKKNLSKILGLEHMKLIAAESALMFDKPIPILAIGGIELEDVRPIMEAGLHGCAVSAAVARSEHKIISSAKFANELMSIPEILS